MNLLQQLNTISNPNGVGIPVSTYTSEMQKILTQQLTTVPNNELSTLNASQSALTALQAALQSFQTATYTLASSANWNSVSAASSDPSAFTATTASGAQPGIYSLLVTALAQNQTNIQNSDFASSASGSSYFTSGTITLTPTTVNGGTTQTINVAASESLNSIASAVNADTALTGVQAQVLYNGSSYQLGFSATQTGTAYKYKLGGTLIGTGTGQFTTTNTAPADASINLGGVTLSSSTDTFVNSIPNVTINVANTMSTAGTLSIASSTSGTVAAVQTWMSSYNSLIDLLHKDTAYTPSTNTSNQNASGTSGPLFTDTNANNLLSQLPTAVSQIVSGVSSNLSSLAAVGIVENPTTGHLEFQSSSGFTGTGSSFTGTLPDGQTMFTNALTSNASGVQQLFGIVQNNTASTAIPTSGVLGNVSNLLTTYLTGAGGQPSPIQSDLNSISAQETNINSYLTQINQQIAQNVANFTSQLNALNAAIQQSQAQTQALSALLGGSSSGSSSSGSSIP
ncbi:MAG: flagellar filament capping protein FliD [Bacilli bacterium]